MPEETAKLKAEMDTLKDDISSLTRTIKELTKDKVSEGKSKLFDGLSLEDFKDSLDKIKNKGKDGIGSVESEIKEYPLQSVAITFGLGVLFALFLSRK